MCSSFFEKERINMMNPAILIKLMSAKDKFVGNHPKFAAFIKQVVLGGGLTEGTVVEITLTRPGEAPISANLKVLQSDLELFEELKDLAK